LGTKTPEAPVHSEKPRRRQHAPDNSEARPFRGHVGRVSQCNLCPTRIEVSTDAAVLSVPTVTLVAWARREKSSFCCFGSLPKVLTQFAAKRKSIRIYKPCMVVSSSLNHFY
jgi:hypothetical protein